MERAENVFVENRQRKFRLDLDQFKKAVGAVLGALKVADREVSVLLLSDPAMRKMNLEYRGIRGTTDVLSFAMDDGEFGDPSGRILGDLVISVETIVRQAGQPFTDGRPQTHSPQEELALMTIHGLLHLVGFDHETSEEDAREMIRRENELFGQFSGLFPAVV